MTSLPLTPDESREVYLHLETTPLRLREIAVATDFSDQATQAVRIAAILARQLNSSLHVLHVTSPIVDSAGAGTLASALQEIDLRNAEGRLSRYINRIPEARSLKHEEIVVCDSVTEAIPAIVESKAIDLLVMGSYGRSGLGKLVLGSRAENVIRHLSRPVLVAGPGCTGNFESTKSIVLATDLIAGSLRAAQYATSLAESTGAKLTLIHAIADRAVKDTFSLEANKKSAIEQMLLLIPNTVESRTRSRFEVAIGNPAEQILQIADERKADLIVMGVREQEPMADHAPWATLSEVIRRARCPVLAVRPHIA
jgi:nucleotide-binding universal stress UspA family protein